MSDAGDMASRVRDALVAGKVDEAIALCAAAFDGGLETAELRYFAGLANFRSGKLAVALESMERAVALDPARADYYADLAALRFEVGDAEGAEAALREGLGVDPASVPVLGDLGQLLMDQRRYEEAADLLDSLLRIEPYNVDGLNRRGLIELYAGRVVSASGFLERALKLVPDEPSLLGNLGICMRQRGEFEAAVGYLERAIQLQPDVPELFNNLGSAQLGLDAFDEAREAFEKALELKPDMLEALTNLGTALMRMNRHEEAIASFERAIKVDSSQAVVHHGLALVYRGLHQYGRTIQCLEAARERAPDDVEIGICLGEMLNTIGRNEQARNLLEKVVERHPDADGAHNGLAAVLMSANSYDDARVHLERAIELNPDNASAHFNLGQVFRVHSMVDEARACWGRAMDLEPDNPKPRWAHELVVPVLYDRMEDIEPARVRYECGLAGLASSVRLDSPKEVERSMEACGARTNFQLAYQAHDDRPLQEAYGDLLTRVMQKGYPLDEPVAARTQARSRIRVGYISSFFWKHTVGKLFGGWVGKVNPERFETCVYYLGHKVDELTEDLRRRSDHFFQCTSSLQAVIDRIRADAPDVLVYPEIGMNPMVMQLAALRLAPVQCMAWGHPVTSGLKTIDYFLTSELMEPEGGERFYSEELVRLPALSISYLRPAQAAAGRTREQFGLSEAATIYLCCQSLFKYLPEDDWIFAKIAEQVPSAQLVFIRNKSSVITRRFVDRLQRTFDACGLDVSQRCVFMQHLSADDYLELNGLADIYLDSLHWSGGNTTLEALSCGLPIVTWPGPFMRSRHTYAILQQLGVCETIADTPEAFVEVAVRLGADAGWRTEIVAQMRANSDRVFDNRECLEGLADFYQRAVADAG